MIDDLSFTAEAGQPVILTGPNGAGKTTLLRVLAGLAEPDGGTLVLEGAPPDAARGEFSHYTGHRDAITAALTVAENIRFWATFLGGSDGADARVDRALAAFELDALADTPCRYLSAGQRRRTGLARLIAAERAVWLLDEPTVSLDARSTALLTAAIEQHVAGGGLVIAATHAPLALANAFELRLGLKARAA